MKEQFFYQELHSKTKRDYLARMNAEKPECMKVARQFGKDFWLGDRKYGYGGYKYDGRQSVLAEKLVKEYRLTNKSSVLDIGCAKGYLLYEIKRLLPECKIHGMDISKHAVDYCKKGMTNYLEIIDQIDIQKKYDLIVSVNTLHNLKIFDLEKALRSISVNSDNSYIVVESFRNEQELCNLQCWALTCQAWFSPKEWNWIFNKAGYVGDYEFIYFE